MTRRFSPGPLSGPEESPFSRGAEVYDSMLSPPLLRFCCVLFAFLFLLSPRIYILVQLISVAAPPPADALEQVWRWKL